MKISSIGRPQGRFQWTIGRKTWTKPQNRPPQEKTMLYRFKSKATGDVIMLEPNGHQVLQLLGREPTPKGIIEPADAAGAIQILKAAVLQAEAEAAASGATPKPGEVSLRQRVWPLVDMLTRAHAAGEPVVWGV
jgi:Domain of unknown function (DUF1840)